LSIETLKLSKGLERAELSRDQVEALQESRSTCIGKSDLEATAARVEPKIGELKTDLSKEINLAKFQAFWAFAILVAAQVITHFGTLNLFRVASSKRRTISFVIMP